MRASASTWWCQDRIRSDSGSSCAPRSPCCSLSLEGNGSSAPPTPTGSSARTIPSRRGGHRLSAGPGQRRTRGARSPMRTSECLRRAAITLASAGPTAKLSATCRRVPVRVRGGDHGRQVRLTGSWPRTPSTPPSRGTGQEGSALVRKDVPLLGAEGWRALQNSVPSLAEQSDSVRLAWKTSWAATVPRPRNSRPDPPRPFAR